MFRRIHAALPLCIALAVLPAAAAAQTPPPLPGAGTAGGPPPLPQTLYYVELGGQPAGPFPIAEIAARLGPAFGPSTLVWADGMANWEMAGRVAELAPLFGAAQAPAAGGFGSGGGIAPATGASQPSTFGEVTGGQTAPGGAGGFQSGGLQSGGLQSGGLQGGGGFQNTGQTQSGGFAGTGQPTSQPGGQGIDPQMAQMLQQLEQMERQDFGVQATAQLHSGPTHGQTPASIPGGQIITTRGLVELVQGQSAPFLLFDVLGAPETLPGAIQAYPASAPGSFSDQTQQQFKQFLDQVTQGSKEVPLIFFCQSVECWMSYNASLRAINAGFTNVLWYRGGLAAWKQAGLPTTGGGGGFGQTGN